MFLKKIRAALFLLLTTIFIGLQVFPQTTPLTFTSIPINDPDLNAPGRGVEQWHDRNEVNVPIEGTNTQRLDVYFRFVWTQIEGPALGSYNWNFFDSLVNYAITRKQKMSFGIMPLYPGGTLQNGLVSYDGGYAAYPLYLHTLMQAESVKDWRTGTVWTPNYNSLNYQNRLLALHQAINAHLNTTSFNGVLYKNVIGYIDLRGYGAWGEWHSGYTAKNVVSDYPAGTFPTIATLKKIVDAHTQGFPDYPLVAMIAAFDANWLQNTMNPPEIAYYVLTQRNNWGLIGWRRDQWGATDGYVSSYLENNDRTFGGLVFRDSIMARWKSAPINGEPPGWNPNSFADLERQVRFYHAASFGNGNYGTTPTSTIKSRVRAASKACGYRLIIESGNLTLNGNNLTVALNWKNIGLAPTYENWNVEFELKNSNNQTIWSGQSQFKPKWFLPSGSATIVTDNFTALPIGTFKLNIIIKDPNGYRDPLPLAITGRNADGSYPIMQQITTQSLVPTPNVDVTNNCGYSVLTASGYTGTLLWSTGETTPSITVTAPGLYTATQTVGGVTSAPGGSTAAPKAIPSAPAVAVANNCGNSLLTATGATGTILWSTGQTTSSITVSTAGTYTVTQTMNGCTSSAGSGTAAPLNSVVDAPFVNVVNNCDNSVLTATDYTGTLLWSNGATTSSITVTTGGTYTVTQTINGCSSPAASATSAPKPTPAAPGISVSNNCGSSVLTATGITGSLSWSTGETTNSITLLTAGTYTLSQEADGCTSSLASATVAPNVIPVTPGVTVVDNCGNSVLTATGVTGTLLWSTGQTTNSITVTTAGSYTVTQTINGCTSAEGSETAAPLISTVEAPAVDVTNNCGNSVLTATGATGSILWSTGETTSSITVTTAGTYTVTQTEDGCSSPAANGTAAPTPIPSAPGISVINNCGNSELTATGVAGSILWSTGETANFITTTTSGSYTVSQTVNGCTSSLASETAAPIAIPTAPGISVSNNCGSSVLTATGFTGSLLWSTGQTTNSIAVTTAGSYSVTQTINGCTSAAGSGTATPLSSAVDSPVVNVLNNCGNSVLTASGFTGTLLWSNGATTASITVATAGTYTVTQTVNGCMSPASSGVAAPKATPVLSSNLSAAATSGVAFSYTATSTTGGTTFAWSRAAVTGISNTAATGTGNISETLVNTTTSPVNVTYVYTLTANGCTNNQDVIVTVNPVSAVNCMINGSITSSFTSTSITAGRFIWFSSVIDRGSISGINGTVTFNITNSRITFTANSQQYILNVPNSRIRFDAAVTSATTQFVNNAWETAVPRSYSNDVFMGGLNYQVPVNLPGNISNVTWTATISIDKAGIRPTWKWAAAVYTSLGAHSALGIKPKNGSSQNPYPNNDDAGTPENYKSFVVSGAKGTGGTNYTGSYSSASTVTCTTSTGQRSAEPVPVTTTERLIVKDIPSLHIELSEGEKLAAIVVPNPTSTSFNLVVKGNGKGPVSVKVIDISGRVVERYEKVPANHLLRVGQRLAAGSYFVEVIKGDQKKIIRVVKVN